MNKNELIGAIATGSGLTQEESKKALNAALDAIKNTLANGDKVQILGFGTFSVKDRAARTGINPKTKEPLEIPASKTPHFKAGKAFKNAIVD